MPRLRCTTPAAPLDVAHRHAPVRSTTRDPGGPPAPTTSPATRTSLSSHRCAPSTTSTRSETAGRSGRRPTAVVPGPTSAAGSRPAPSHRPGSHERGHRRTSPRPWTGDHPRAFGGHPPVPGPDTSRSSGDPLDEAGELVEVADLDHVVDVPGVVRGDRVAAVPELQGFGVQPVHVAGPALEVRQHPGSGLPVV